MRRPGLAILSVLPLGLLAACANMPMDVASAPPPMPAPVPAAPSPPQSDNARAQFIVDQRATPVQRDALLRIFSGKDTEPGATVWQVFSTTFTRVHDPIFAQIEFDVDIEHRTARLTIPNLIESRGEPIRNPVTGAEHQARIELPRGFEYRIAEMGRY